jgi:hypothetical protein
VQRYLWRVHLDDSKTVPDPDDPERQVPDPGVGARARVPRPAARPMKVAEYVEEQRAEIALLAEHELERMEPTGRHLGGEGEEL